MDRLKDKVALITGATGGIGEASAKLFASEGAKLMLLDLDQQKNNYQQLIEKVDGKISYFYWLLKDQEVIISKALTTKIK